MGIRVKLLATLGTSGLAGAFLFGTALLHDFGYRSVFFPNHSRADTLCSGRSNVSEMTFYREMSRVNARMHAAMEIKPSGSTNRDFARMMIAHHQGAIDMARVQLKYGGDERLRRLAQSIIVEQAQEITYMRHLFDTNQSSSSSHIFDQ
jgi:Domain of unknown function (DUF305)